MESLTSNPALENGPGCKRALVTISTDIRFRLEYRHRVADITIQDNRIGNRYRNLDEDAVKRHAYSTHEPGRRPPPPPVS